MCLAVPGRVLDITDPEDDLARRGRVDFGGVVKEVNLAYVPEAGVGDFVVVHAGFAISIVDEEEARQVLGFLKTIEQAGETEE